MAELSKKGLESVKSHLFSWLGEERRRSDKEIAQRRFVGGGRKAVKSDIVVTS